MANPRSMTVSTLENINISFPNIKEEPIVETSSSSYHVKIQITGDLIVTGEYKDNRLCVFELKRALPIELED
jgi:hypothetical protein